MSTFQTDPCGVKYICNGYLLQTSVIQLRTNPREAEAMSDGETDDKNHVCHRPVFEQQILSRGFRLFAAQERLLHGLTADTAQEAIVDVVVVVVTGYDRRGYCSYHWCAIRSQCATRAVAGGYG